MYIPLILLLNLVLGGCTAATLPDNNESREISTNCTTNGIRNVVLPNFDPFPALCNSDIAGPGWIVIQQRINGEENFFRNWEDYKNGFGNFTGDFFLGLEKIYRLTKDTPHELHIDMEAFKGGEAEMQYRQNIFHASYDNFSIAGKDDKYRLLGTYSGHTDEDRMRYSEGAQFSTFDNDNDEWKHDNFAEFLHSGWWNGPVFPTCNLNGEYYQQEQVDTIFASWWSPFSSLKTIKMLIRPRGH